MEQLIIGVTGHRHLEDAGKVEHEIRLAITKLKSQKNPKEIIAYSSLAIGADTIFADVCLSPEFGATLKVILPFDLNEYKELGFDKDQSRKLDDLLQRSTETTHITKAVVEKSEVNNYYLKAGKKIVEQCNVIIAVYDGLEAGGTGGTADIVDYVKEQNKELIIIKAFKSDIAALQYKRDHKAKRLKFWYELLWTIAVGCSFASAFILAISICFVEEKNESEKRMLASLEFMCVLLAAIIIIFLKGFFINRKKFVLNYTRLNFRREAERLRVLEKFVTCGIEITDELEPFDNISEEAKAMEKKYVEKKMPSIGFINTKEELLKLIKSQVEYHEGRPAQIKGMFSFLEKVRFPIFVAFVISVSMHTIGSWINHEYTISLLQHEIHVSEVLHLVGQFFSLSIPPAYAAIEGFIYFKEYHKIIRDSKNMLSYFKYQEKYIESLSADDPQSQAKLNNVAQDIRIRMDDETKEWYVVMESKTFPGV
ncbi:MAG: hypothetical protein QM737_02320 [Ferruginibacter sp.]